MRAARANSGSRCNRGRSAEAARREPSHMGRGDSQQSPVGVDSEKTPPHGCSVAASRGCGSLAAKSLCKLSNRAFPTLENPRERARYPRLRGRRARTGAGTPTVTNRPSHRRNGCAGFGRLGPSTPLEGTHRVDRRRATNFSVEAYPCPNRCSRVTCSHSWPAAEPSASSSSTKR